MRVTGSGRAVPIQSSAMPSIPRTISHIGTTRSTVARAAEVAALFTRFGFNEFLRETGLDHYLPGGKGEAGEESGSPLPVRVRRLIEELGPTFIKAGQIASTRGDLLPDDWIAEFKKLQSTVPPEPWDGEDGIRQVLVEDYGEELEPFAWVDEASMAAASLAQVHRARLRSGEDVVLKILRPRVREQLQSDIELMRFLSRFVGSHLESMGFDPQRVIDEFAKQLHRETDLRQEARSVARMREDFKDNEGVSFPYVYSNLCTRSVLVQNEVKGRLLSSVDYSTLSQAQRERIIRNGADAVFQQCLVIGFFHADPHPGNIFLLEKEALCFIDCGMTGLIEPATRRQIAEITYGAINGDIGRVVNVAIELSGADPALADDRGFRADAWHFVDQFHGGSLASIKMGYLLDEFFKLLRKYHIQCPADIVYLIKALTTIEGVATDIAPEFDLVTHVRPYVEKLIKARYGFSAIKDRLEGALVSYADLIEDIPHDAGILLKRLRQNELSIQLEHSGIGRLNDEIERASLNISWSLWWAAMIVGASVLILADSIDRESSLLTTLATITFAIAVTLGLIRLVQTRIAFRLRHKARERRDHSD